ncbi:hypothetical protein GQ600_16033 [Phytophthora cactorum]|nr:hypothetical protein GQ600_16033 [Phytophthora cactorum]
MGGHRETRRESDAFKARLEERSSEDRHRLAAEHRAYLAGEHATDADFGPGEARAAQAPQPAHVPRPTKTPSRPPMGKAAAYLAALKKRKAENDGRELTPHWRQNARSAERRWKTKGTNPEGESSVGERGEAAQEAIAVSRDRAEATKKTLARAKKHHTADREEKREKKEKKACSAQKKGKKGQETAKKRRTCPHDAFSDGDADDESNISSSTRAFSERETPRASADGRPNESTSLLQLRPAAR